MYLQNLEITSNRNINYRDLMIFIVPILIFSLYLFIYNPGILTSDSFAQMHQIASGQFTNKFPFFHTFIEMILLNIFGTPIIMEVLQIILFSVIWTVICKYHRDDASESSNKFTLQFIVTLIICLIPINAVYSVTLWPQILFSYSLLFLSFLIKVLIDRNGEMSLKFAIILALTIAITSQLSSIGIYIGIISLVAILWYLYIKNKEKDRLFLLFPALTILFILIIGSLSFAYSIEDAQTDNSMGSPLVWSVLRGDDWTGQAYYLTNGKDFLKGAQNKFYTENNVSQVADYEKLTSANLRNGNYNLVNSYAVYFKDHTLTDTLFYSPALYMYLAIILLIGIQMITKSKEMYLVYIPNLINIIGVFLTTSSTENRILYPNLLVFYLLVIIFISIYFRSGVKSLPITLNSKKTEEQKENSYVPSEPVQSQYDVNDSYYDEYELEMEDGTLDQPEIHQEEDFDSELLDEILKEIEMEKKDK